MLVEPVGLAPTADVARHRRTSRYSRRERGEVPLLVVMMTVPPRRHTTSCVPGIFACDHGYAACESSTGAYLDVGRR